MVIRWRCDLYNGVFVWMSDMFLFTGLFPDDWCIGLIWPFVEKRRVSWQSYQLYYRYTLKMHWGSVHILFKFFGFFVYWTSRTCGRWADGTYERLCYYWSHFTLYPMTRVKNGCWKMHNFPTPIGPHSYGSWDKSRNSYPLRNHIILNLATTGALETTWLPHWELCNFSRGMSSCYILFTQCLQFLKGSELLLYSIHTMFETTINDWHDHIYC